MTKPASYNPEYLWLLAGVSDCMCLQHAPGQAEKKPPLHVAAEEAESEPHHPRSTLSCLVVRHGVHTQLGPDNASFPA